MGRQFSCRRDLQGIRAIACHLLSVRLQMEQAMKDVNVLIGIRSLGRSRASIGTNGVDRSQFLKVREWDSEHFKDDLSGCIHCQSVSTVLTTSRSVRVGYLHKKEWAERTSPQDPRALYTRL